MDERAGPQDQHQPGGKAYRCPPALPAPRPCKGTEGPPALSACPRAREQANRRGGQDVGSHKACRQPLEKNVLVTVSRLSASWRPLADFMRAFNMAPLRTASNKGLVLTGSFPQSTDTFLRELLHHRNSNQVIQRSQFRGTQGILVLKAPLCSCFKLLPLD